MHLHAHAHTIRTRIHIHITDLERVHSLTLIHPVVLGSSIHRSVVMGHTHVSFKGEFRVKWDSDPHFFELIQNNSLLIILFIIYL